MCVAEVVLVIGPERLSPPSYHQCNTMLLSWLESSANTVGGLGTPGAPSSSHCLLTVSVVLCWPLTTLLSHSGLSHRLISGDLECDGTTISPHIFFWQRHQVTPVSGPHYWQTNISQAGKYCHAPLLTSPLASPLLCHGGTEN